MVKLLPTKENNEPLVSIIIPTRGITAQGDTEPIVVGAVQSILSKSTYSNFEIVLVVDSVGTETLQEIYQFPDSRKIQLLEWHEHFNFSRKINFGVVHSKGEYLLVLNDDVEVISPNWINSLLEQLTQEHAGLAGAMLYFEDDSVQHAGHGFVNGSPTHLGIGYRRGEAGPMNALTSPRKVPGVTAACALVSRKVFFEVGGFCNELPGNYNDVDFCQKILAKGYDIYWTPYAELYHFESKTRNASVAPYETEMITRRWGNSLSSQEFWPGNPHKPVRS